MKKKWIELLFDLFILILILYYFIFLWEDYPFSLGGTLIFMSFIGVIKYFSIKFKSFSYELSFFSLIPIILMGLNFFAYYEEKNGFSYVVISGIIVSLLLLTKISLFLSIRPFMLTEGENLSENKIDFIKNISYFFMQYYLSLFFIVTTIAIFMGMRCGNYIIYEKRLFNCTSICVFWLLIGLLYNQIILKKYRKYFNQYFGNVELEEKVVKNEKFKKITILFITMLIIGSGLEMGRGYWTLWIMSLLILFLFILHEWESWRFIINSKNNHIADNAIKRMIDTIKFPEAIFIFYNFKKFLFLFLSGLLYITIFLLIEFYVILKSEGYTLFF